MTHQKGHTSVLTNHFDVRYSEESVFSSESLSENDIPLERRSHILRSSKKILKAKKYQTFEKFEKIEILFEIIKRIHDHPDWKLQNNIDSLEDLLKFLEKNSNPVTKEIIRGALLKQVFLLFIFLKSHSKSLGFNFGNTR